MEKVNKNIFSETNSTHTLFHVSTSLKLNAKNSRVNPYAQCMECATIYSIRN